MSKLHPRPEKSVSGGSGASLSILGGLLGDVGMQTRLVGRQPVTLAFQGKRTEMAFLGHERMPIPCSRHLPSVSQLPVSLPPGPLLFMGLGRAFLFGFPASLLTSNNVTIIYATPFPKLNKRQLSPLAFRTKTKLVRMAAGLWPPSQQLSGSLSSFCSHSDLIFQFLNSGSLV